MPRRKFRVTQSPPLPPTEVIPAWMEFQRCLQKNLKTFAIVLKSTQKADFVAFPRQAWEAGRRAWLGVPSPSSGSLLPGRAPAHPRGLGAAVGPRARTRGSRRKGFPTLKATQLRTCFLQPWPCRSLLLRNTFARAEGCSRCAQLGALPGPAIEIFKALQNY